MEIEECGLFLGSSNPAWKRFRGGLNLAAWRVRVGVISRGWGWLNRGLVRHGRESGDAVNEDANENMSSIFHPRHFQMGCGVFRSFEPVEQGEVDGKAAICAQHRFLPRVRWEGKSAPGLFDPILFALGGDSDT